MSRTITLFAALLAIPASAGTVHVYQGRIGERTAVLEISFAGKKVSGTIAVAPKYTRRKVTVTIAGRSVNLSVDGGAEIRGSFLEKDPAGRFRGQLNREVLSASLLDGESEFKVEFRLEHSVAAVRHAEAVRAEPRIRRFLRALADGDREALAESISFPFRANFGQKKAIIVKNEADLDRRFAEIFTAATVRRTESVPPIGLFCNAEGIMSGNGSLWFGYDGKLIAVNAREAAE